MHYDCYIVDDEEAIAASVSEYFNLFGVNTAFGTGRQECLDFFARHTASILLLDINLDSDSGFQLCKELRQSSDIPVFFISARDSDEDVLTALNIGGDDYIKKPFSLNILLAKVKAALKRYGRSGQPGPGQAGASASASANRVVFANVLMDTDTLRVTVDGRQVRLKEMEYRLLLYLAENKNRVVSKDELLEKVWQDLYIGEGTISVHIRHLREKIEANPDQPALIKTVWGIGYMLEDPA